MCRWSVFCLFCFQLKPMRTKNLTDVSYLPYVKPTENNLPLGIEWGVWFGIARQLPNMKTNMQRKLEGAMAEMLWVYYQNKDRNRNWKAWEYWREYKTYSILKKIWFSPQDTNYIEQQLKLFTYFEGTNGNLVCLILFPMKVFPSLVGEFDFVYLFVCLTHMASWLFLATFFFQLLKMTKLNIRIVLFILKSCQVDFLLFLMKTRLKKNKQANAL